MATPRGSNYNNITETWQQNEEREGGGRAGEATGVSQDLQNTIKEEAAEYDNSNKEDRVLSGDRATENDSSGNTGDE